jgi:type I restriction enzyme S subunit
MPSLAIQKRIVSKVAELMSLCDRIERSLIDTADRRTRLLEALLHHALKPMEVMETVE